MINIGYVVIFVDIAFKRCCYSELIIIIVLCNVVIKRV